MFETDVFIVRIWREATKRADVSPPWRGQVEHLPSNQKVGFTSLRALCRFVAKAARLGGAGGPGDDVDTTPRTPEGTPGR